ncbi:MAG: hypothetical protein Q4A17_10415 [Thermoguttaceae bacterium]|nr:hypothetical protein [Thermoguttaceae bacterium]
MSSIDRMPGFSGGFHSPNDSQNYQGNKEKQQPRLNVPKNGSQGQKARNVKNPDKNFAGMIIQNQKFSKNLNK